jgi:hypothetical protein
MKDEGKMDESSNGSESLNYADHQAADGSKHFILRPLAFILSSSSFIL